jgi:hypothetical protein
MSKNALSAGCVLNPVNLKRSKSSNIADCGLRIEKKEKFVLVIRNWSLNLFGIWCLRFGILEPNSNAYSVKA